MHYVRASIIVLSSSIHRSEFNRTTSTLVGICSSSAASSETALNQHLLKSESRHAATTVQRHGGKTLLPNERTESLPVGEMKAPSPKDTKCKFCGRRFTKRGLREHQRHHCAKCPDRKPRKFKKSQCRHCGKILHGNGLRAHVAQVHPEQYARSRSVKAHRMEEKRRGSEDARKEGRHKHSRQRSTASHAQHSRESSSAPPQKHRIAHQPHQDETRAETTQRIWGEVRKRTPLPTQNHRPSGNLRPRDQETA